MKTTCTQTSSPKRLVRLHPNFSRRQFLIGATTLTAASAVQLPFASTASPTTPGPSGTQTFKPVNFKEQLLYQRAFEAVLWSLPAADTLVMRRAQKEWGMKE